MARLHFAVQRCVLVPVERMLVAATVRGFVGMIVAAIVRGRGLVTRRVLVAGRMPMSVGVRGRTCMDLPVFIELRLLVMKSRVRVRCVTAGMRIIAVRVLVTAVRVLVTVRNTVHFLMIVSVRARRLAQGCVCARAKENVQENASHNGLDRMRTIGGQLLQNAGTSIIPSDGGGGHEHSHEQRKSHRFAGVAPCEHHREAHRQPVDHHSPSQRSLESRESEHGAVQHNVQG